MRYCQQCVLPDTRPGIRIGADGVCNACRRHAAKIDSIDWAARGSALDRLLDDARSRSSDYDCLIPVSGGKDSTWQVATCLERGLRILAVTWRTPGRTALGQRNLDNLIRLGVDHIDYTINPETERKFTLRALERTGSTGVPMHFAIYNIPLRLAVRLNIPLVIWGENPHTEYGATDQTPQADRLDPDWGRRHGILQGTSIGDWIDNELTRAELAAYIPPSAKEFARANVVSVFLGDYLPWDPTESLRVARAHGFTARAEGPRLGLYDFADVDCAFISVHHHFKWLKFGFTRLFDNLALEIRNQRVSRQQAIETIRQRGDQTPREDIEALCAFLRISRARFAEIEERFRNHAVWQRREDGLWWIPEFLIPDWDWACDSNQPILQESSA